jgi:hypothetical protein
MPRRWNHAAPSSPSGSSSAAAPSRRRGPSYRPRSKASGDRAGKGGAPRCTRSRPPMGRSSSGRSRRVRPLAGSHQCDHGAASVPARPSAGTVSPCGCDRRSAADAGRPQGRFSLARTGRPVHDARAPVGRRRAGASGCGGDRTLAHPDRPAAPSGRCALGWHARRDRGRLQGRQTRRLAWGADRHDRSPARRAAVVDRGVGDLAGGACWRRRRGGAPSAPGGGIAGAPQRPPARPWPPGAARPELFPARAVGAVGGRARWRLAPRQAGDPRTRVKTS